MGVWYFLILFIGIFLLVRVMTRRSSNPFKKLLLSLLAICMIAVSIFMFQDGSAEIVDQYWKKFR